MVTGQRRDRDELVYAVKAIMSPKGMFFAGDIITLITQREQRAIEDFAEKVKNAVATSSYLPFVEEKIDRLLAPYKEVRIDEICKDRFGDIASPTTRQMFLGLIEEEKQSAREEFYIWFTKNIRIVEYEWDHGEEQVRKHLATYTSSNEQE